MAFKNQTTRLNIAYRKMAEMQDLKLRAPKEYQEVIGEFLLSLKSIIEDEKRQFKKHYKKAGELLRELSAG